MGPEPGSNIGPSEFRHEGKAMSHTGRIYHRRQLLLVLGGGLPWLNISEPVGAFNGESKKIEGVFPIGFSPFTQENKLDVEGLASQVRFCIRGGVHGFVWPQIASAWTTLNETERMA